MNKPLALALTLTIIQVEEIPNKFKGKDMKLLAMAREK